MRKISFILARSINIDGFVLSLCEYRPRMFPNNMLFIFVDSYIVDEFFVTFGPLSVIVFAPSSSVPVWGLEKGYEEDLAENPEVVVEPLWAVVGLQPVRKR